MEASTVLSNIIKHKCEPGFKSQIKLPIKTWKVNVVAANVIVCCVR